ncbi:rhomboid-like protein [Spirillospora sp. CA-294931]|uniref:rhomboid-like protein n=1 Tax=Spirillospora sp. CA-294931 TaxID=3240042 RepID=UPI003D91DDA9
MGLLRRYSTPLVYLGAYGAMSVVYLHALSPRDREGLVAWASTNLDNLPDNPVGTMVVSAFVAEGSQAGLFVVGALGLFPVARRFGNSRALLLISLGHVVGTLVSQGVAAWRLELGELPESVRTASDVGPSYVISAALVAAILYGPGRLARLGALAGYLAAAPSLFEGLTSLEIGALGHVVAMLTGGAVGGAFVLAERRRAAPGS